MFTRTVPVRKHKAESPMKKADVLVRLTLGVVALVGTKVDKIGFSRAWLSSTAPLYSELVDALKLR